MKLTSPLAALSAALLLIGTASAQIPDIARTDANQIPNQQQLHGNSPRISWTSLTAAPTIRSRPGGAWIGANFFLVGGETTGGARVATVDIYNNTTGLWSSSAAAMPTPVSNIFGSTCSIGSKIYVFGGYSALAAGTNQVQIYDTIADTWSVHATPLTVPIWGALAVHGSGNDVIVTGGYDGLASVTTTYTFNVLSGLITPKAPAPTPRYLLSGAYNNSNGTVYVVAGYGSGTVMTSFHPVSNTWTTLASLPVDRAGCGVVAVGNNVVVYYGNWTVYSNNGDKYSV